MDIFKIYSIIINDLSRLLLLAYELLLYIFAFVDLDNFESLIVFLLGMLQHGVPWMRAIGKRAE